MLEMYAPMYGIKNLRGQSINFGTKTHITSLFPGEIFCANGVLSDDCLCSDLRQIAVFLFPEFSHALH